MRKTLGKEKEGLCSTLPSGSSMLRGRAAEALATIDERCRKERTAANGGFATVWLLQRLSRSCVHSRPQEDVFMQDSNTLKLSASWW